MTIALAVRKNGKTYIAADSLVTFGGQRFAPENCQFHKIQRIGDSLMAWAGWSLYTEILTAHLHSADPPRLTTELEVFNFFVHLSRAMRNDFLWLQRESQNHPFADLDSTFLLVNKSGLFRVASDMDVTEFQQYTAVGSGSKYALGALRLLYDQLDDPQEIARVACQVGIDCDVFCGGPIDIVEVR
jgi:ATP-dependent HslUV protease, peptidase subunit HslV